MMDAKTKELARQAGFDIEDGAGDGEIWFDEGWYTSLVERFAALIRADERESMGVKVRADEFIAAASKAPDATGRPIMWAEFPTRENT